MSSLVIDTSHVLPAPRVRRIAWWAAGAVCGLHALLAWCLWREAGERPAMPLPPRQETAFFVDLLPVEPARREATLPEALPPSQAGGSQEPAASGQPGRPPESARPSAPATRPAPATPPRPASRAAPQAPQTAPKTSTSPTATPSTAKPASAPTGPPPHDFRWRGEDAAAQGAPRARGEARVDLAPKPRAEPSALAKGIAQSARPPCRDAHAHLGLLALPFLLADTVRDDGCKW
ncbi:hypothetical protein LMG3458_02662 [Achromobacter deleyi]|uniref:Uncharacterized protein n=1 Tax=Achromobacter deleyi TaxID=1353891 RepID=A0A6S6ZX51_9BURK|nr:hypothetical protein LMG3458_02662 [Achromobacter deleyi]CAB3849927.1 hypothetical protein LMG3481_01701 [Achromobacter deleyi]CAB3872683.1 hypothetical protein LMG3482_02869 [Achromobacter deleyi]